MLRALFKWPHRHCVFVDWILKRNVIIKSKNAGYLYIEACGAMTEIIAKQFTTKDQ